MVVIASLKVTGIYFAPFVRYSQILVENHRFNLPHLYLASLSGVTPLEFCRDHWHQKTRRIALSCGIKNIAGRFFGLVTKHAVTDRQTDGRTDGQTELRLTPKTALT